MRQGVECYVSFYNLRKTCTFYLNEYWTQEIIGYLNWLAAFGAACAGISALLVWLFGVTTAGVAICGAVSGVAWLAAETIRQIDKWGGYEGVYFRAYFYRVRWWYFGWRYGRWHYTWSYIWHQ
jgi:hypothetical protein